MSWELQSDRPIYTQLLTELKRRIVAGMYKPGDKLMPVRELAQEAQVNPNTMQRALAELERQGLVYAVRTTGRFITEDEELIRKAKNEIASSHVKSYTNEMKALGYSQDEMIQMLLDYKEGIE